MKKAAVAGAMHQKIKSKTSKKKKVSPSLLAPPEADTELTSSNEDLNSLWDDAEQEENRPVTVDSLDDDILTSFHGYTFDKLIERCLTEIKSAERPPLIQRSFRTLGDVDDDNPPLRILQWNILAQAMAENQGCACSAETLNWTSRRFQIVQELAQLSPDVICLQEVDHFNFVETALGSVGYVGRFLPKPKSLCIQLKGNNGPDGCAIFYKTARLEQLTVKSRVLEAWGVQSNQVALAFDLRDAVTGLELCVATTHLKARKGVKYEKLRERQGKDLLEWMTKVAGSRPAILTGDFNADPNEPVYKSILQCPLGLQSAYCQDKEPSYTSWQSGYYHTIDYIFHSIHGQVVKLLDFPAEDQFGPDHLPTDTYPSDHLALIADIVFTEDT